MAAPQWSGGKCKDVQKAKAFFRHNDKDRRMEMNHKNVHIDKSKTHLNFTYRGLTYKELCKAFDDKLDSVDVGRESSGKNARVILQSVILYPPPGLPKSKEREWFMDAGRVLENRFGDNLLEIQFDMDEEHEYTDPETKQKKISRNHGHARLFPEVNGKLNGKEFSKRSVITGLNEELDEMSYKKYGVRMMDGSKKKGGKTVESLKAASLQAEIEQKRQELHNLNVQIEAAQKQQDEIREEYAAEKKALADVRKDHARLVKDCTMLTDASDRLQNALQTDLGSIERKEAKKGAAGLLTALGASVRAAWIPTPKELDNALQNVGAPQGEVTEFVRTKLLQQAMAMAKRTDERQPGRSSVEYTGF